MSTDIERGRNDLLAWRAATPRNWFDWDRNLARVLELRLGPDEFRSERERFQRAGQMVATELSELSVQTNHDSNLPRLERWDGLGVQREAVVFHPSYHDAGRRIWQTGVLSDYGKPGRETLQLGLLYLFAQVGEVGHLCPLACTAGLIKLIQRVGSEEQKQKYLPGLLDTDYDRRVHASQFLTEVQGGSDVGANAVAARREADGWRLYGEKWFCSVIDAQLFLMTARPDGAPAGTRGLGLFIVPRTRDGAVNRFTVRRLKQKLGTRAMASGEADFQGAWADPIGPLDRGFKNVVEHVLNTSRLYNAVCCSGAITAAYREAATFARHRRAFGEPIVNYPLVRETLALLRSEALASISGSLRIASRGDTLLLRGATRDEELAWRVAVNINKYWTAVRNTECARRAIEVLGGNGTIETFSSVVQLYRDAMVLESWEGTHNVLVQQVLKDSARYGAHLAFLKELGEALARATLADRDLGLRQRTESGLAALARGFTRLAAGEGDQRFGRRLVDQAAALLQAVSLLEELAAYPDDDAKRAAIDLHLRRFVANELVPPPPLADALIDDARL
jgi:alkylation response protein AidB-like acyl-CoA dehydrogenase